MEQKDNLIKMNRIEISNILNGPDQHLLKAEVTAWFYRQILSGKIGSADIVFLQNDQGHNRFFIKDRQTFYQNLAEIAKKDQTMFDKFMVFIQDNPNRIWSVYPQMLPVPTAYQLSRILKDANSMEISSEAFIKAVNHNLEINPDFIVSCEELFASEVVKHISKIKKLEATDFLSTLVNECMSPENVFKLEKPLIENWVFMSGDDHKGGLVDLVFFINAGLTLHNVEVIETLDKLIKQKSELSYLVNTIYHRLLLITKIDETLASRALKCMVDNLDFWKKPELNEVYPRLFHEIRKQNPSLYVTHMERILSHLVNNATNSPDSFALIEIMEKWPQFAPKIQAMYHKVSKDFCIGTLLLYQIIHSSNQKMIPEALKLIKAYGLEYQMEAYNRLIEKKKAFAADLIEVVDIYN